MKKLLCLLVFPFSCFLSPVSAQSHIIDSLKNALKTERDDTNKVNTLNALSVRLLRISIYDSSLRHAHDALGIADTLRFYKGEAAALRNMGICYYYRGNYSDALKYYMEGFSVCLKMGDKKGEATILGNIGVVYEEEGNYPKALEYDFKALGIYQDVGNKKGESINLANIGQLYYDQGNYKEALEYDMKALAIEESMSNKEGEASTLGNIGNIYDGLLNYPKALEYDLKALSIFQSIGDKKGEVSNLSNVGALYQEMQQYNKALENCYKALRMAECFGNQSLVAHNMDNIGCIYTKMKKLNDSRLYLDSALLISKKTGFTQYIRDSYQHLAELDSVKGDNKKGWEDYKNYITYRDSLINEAEIKKSTQAEMNYEFGRQTDSAKAVQDRKDAVVASEKQRQEVLKYSFAGGFSIMFIASGVFFVQRRRIVREKKRSDELLLNILPSEVAEELKAKGSADAKSLDDVTVIFTDFKGFTSITEKLTAKELVAEIDYCFKGFDNIIHKYSIEKIKTIGDSYMAAGGLPVANKTHAKDVVNAALEIVKFMEAHKQLRTKENKPVFEIRIGINTGPVVAGIVGVKKFAYDIWGDTVNLASRMESSGEPGKVNISGSTYELVKNDFTCTYRGKIQAKNKGEVDMYFVG